MSGFFFCGMIDDPVEYASENAKNPNSALAHRIRSSHSRDVCVRQIAALAMYSSM